MFQKFQVLRRLLGLPRTEHCPETNLREIAVAGLNCLIRDSGKQQEAFASWKFCRASTSSGIDNDFTSALSEALISLFDPKAVAVRSEEECADLGALTLGRFDRRANKNNRIRWHERTRGRFWGVAATECRRNAGERTSLKITAASPACAVATRPPLAVRH